MAFSQRIATLAAVVAIPLGIAATSYALTDSSETPKVPPKVELDHSGSPTPETTPTTGPSPSATDGTPSGEPSDEAVSRPPVDDDDDDDDRGTGDDAREGDDG
ncbi:small hydrophilic protein [Streptomyces sp. NPDC050418]|uniref:small hydrophilic protein n=1 Tax=Streptomyces sp. NPDC050418 TaxID=3365612 RepID=UPI003792D065